VKNISEYIAILLRKSLLRQIVHACGLAIDYAQEQSESPKTVLDFLDDKILEIRANQKSVAVTPADFMVDHLTALMELREQKSGTVGLSYGIEGTNWRTTGIRPKEFVIIGGRPKEGKTALALEIIQANCSAGIPVAFFSIEMDRDSILDRLFSSYSRIDYNHIRVPSRMDDHEISKLKCAADIITEWPLHIDDSSELSVSELMARARLFVKRHNVGLVVVDYLQLMDAPGRDERARLTKISKGLRMLAKDLKIGVVGLSQLARRQDTNERPQISELKESGSLEADANTIILIYRPRVKGRFTNEDELLITQRSGEGGVCPVTYLGRNMRFEDRV
jgi:replicative DNA helicase